MPPESAGDRERFPYHRRYIRHKVRLKVQVTVEESYQSWTNNVSEDGVCFEIPRTLAVDHEVTVWMFIRRGERPIGGECRVVWHEKGKKSTRHGAQFLTFVADGTERLQAFLAELSRPLSQPPPP